MPDEPIPISTKDTVHAKIARLLGKLAWDPKAVWNNLIAAVIGGVFVFTVTHSVNRYQERVIYGLAVDSASSEPIGHAFVRTVDGPECATDISLATGSFTLTLHEQPPTPVKISVVQDYYEPLDIAVPATSLVRHVFGGERAPFPVRLERHVQNGYVQSRSQQPVGGAKVMVGQSIATSDDEGFFRLHLRVRLGDVLRIVVEKDGIRKEETRPFSPNLPLTINFGENASVTRARPAPRSEAQNRTEQWTLVRQNMDKARENEDLHNFERSWFFYNEAWNNLPDDAAQLTPQLSDEVGLALSEYKEAEFKTASDRVKTVLSAVKIPGKRRTQ